MSICSRRGAITRTKRYMICSDEYTVLNAAKRGDAASFEVLCKHSADTVFRVALRMLRSKEDAEDVVQESLLRAFIHLHSFNGNSRFSTWLSRIVINTALMKLRKKRHLREVPVDESVKTDLPPFSLTMEDPRPNPEQLYAEKERQRIIAEALSELTPGTRRAIELRELNEQSTEEAARNIGISAGAVKSRLFHGRKRLRKRLKRYAEITL